MSNEIQTLFFAFTDPVKTSDGQTYERAQIEDWFEKNPGTVSSPLTNLPLTNRSLTPDQSAS